jgi:hypothetical protein
MDGTAKSFRFETPDGWIQCVSGVLFNLARVTGGFECFILPTFRKFEYLVSIFQVMEFDIPQAFKFTCNRRATDMKFTYMVSFISQKFL